MCMPRALKRTARQMASDLQIPWHNLAHFCCAKFCHFKFCQISETGQVSAKEIRRPTPPHVGPSHTQTAVVMSFLAFSSSLG